MIVGVVLIVTQYTTHMNIGQGVVLLGMGWEHLQFVASNHIAFMGVTEPTDLVAYQKSPSWVLRKWKIEQVGYNEKEITR